MRIATCPIVDFYKNCQKSAEEAGFDWIVTLISRRADTPRFYAELKSLWSSLDSITGEHILFILAGRKNMFAENNTRFRITDKDMGWASIYNDHITIMNPNVKLQGSVYDSENDIFKTRIDDIPETQTAAVYSLRKYLKLSVRATPCLHFLSLRTGERWIIPVTNESDIYNYFKNVIGNIEPLLDAIENTRRASELLVNQKDELSKQLDEFYRIAEMCMKGSMMVEKMNTDKNSTTRDNFAGANISHSTIITGDGSTGYTYVNAYSEEMLSKLLDDVKKSIPEDLTDEKAEIINKQLGYLKEDVEAKKSYKGSMDRAIEIMKSLSSATQFVTAVNKLAEFLKNVFA